MMMKKRTLLLAIGLFVLILTGSRILWNAAFQRSADQLHAVAGVLDLRNWDAAAGRTIALDGQWEFYPNVLLMQRDRDSSAQAVLVQVPGKWNDAMRPGGKTPYGYGSYRLRVLVNPGDDATYSIRVSSVRSSSELYVNGRLLAKSGQPAASADRYVGRNVPYTAAFSTNGGGVIEVVVQAANFTDARGSGLVRSMEFGTEAAIDRETNLSVAMQQVVAVAFLLHAVYALILYMMGFRDRKLIYFAVLVLCAILSILIGSDDKILLYWLPIDLERSLDLIALVSVAGLFSLLQCTIDLLPVYWRTKILPVFALLCGIEVVAVLLLPARYTTTSTNLFLTFGALFVVYAVLSMFRASLKGRDNVLLMLSLIALASNFTWWVIYLATGIKIVYYPFDLIVAMVCFATVWFRQYIRIHAETEMLAAKLQIADKRKDEFLANTSHELRNPLHGILNIAQAVLEREKHALSDKSVKDLEIVLSVGRRMKLMLHDLLDAMRLKESNPRLQIGSFPIQTVVAGVFDMLHFMTEGRPVRLTNRISAQFPHVLADENRVIQIIFNLLHNALKYTNEGEVSIRAHAIGDRVQIVIADTGIGMDEETMRRIFEPYEQAPPDKTMVEGGFGLGLSISKQLVELHGSALEVRSVPGQGSEFAFTLQLDGSMVLPTAAKAGVLASVAEARASVAAASAQEVSNSGQQPALAADRPRILIVDDDPVNLKVLETILSLEHYDIAMATNGKEALAMLDAKEWDLVVSDVMMPHMSGYELARTIRGRFSITELPVLLLTARSRPEDIENGFRAGANDYVTKPVDALELRSRVQALTEVKQSARDRLRMEAAWLQAQIQPHFLFNTLNTVAALSEIDANRMRRLLDVFGDFLQNKFTFQNIDALVPLEHEVNLVRSYLYIEQERFGDRLQVSWELEECGPLTIPPLTIQPLVENAVKHGIMKRAAGGTVRIRLANYETHAEIAVIDDGVGMDAETLRQLRELPLSATAGIGLLNTDLRLKRHFGQGLQIESKPGAGTSISFVVHKGK